MSSHELILLRPEGLRAAVASLDHEIDRLANRSATAGDETTAALLTSWREFVKMLDLGPPPRLRVCPVCGHTGMRAATRCGYCWSKLAALPEEAAEADHATPT